MPESTYNVTGMTCGHCVAAVSQEVSQIPGVEHVDVDLTTGAVKIISNAALDTAQVAAAVDEAGYQLSPMS